MLSTQQRDAERDPGALEDEKVDVVDRIDVQGVATRMAAAPTSGSTRAAECVAERGRRVASEAPRVFILGLCPAASLRRAKLAVSERTATKESSWASRTIDRRTVTESRS